MIEKAVIYNTIDRTGMCPEELFEKLKLPLGVYARVELTREKMKELFSMYDEDQYDGTNLFGETLVDMLHKKLLEKEDKQVSPEVKILNYNPTSKKHLPANIK